MLACQIAQRPLVDAASKPSYAGESAELQAPQERDGLPSTKNMTAATHLEEFIEKQHVDGSDVWHGDPLLVAQADLHRLAITSPCNALKLHQRVPIHRGRDCRLSVRFN